MTYEEIASLAFLAVFAVIGLWHAALWFIDRVLDGSRLHNEEFGRRND